MPRLLIVFILLFTLFAYPSLVSAQANVQEMETVFENVVRLALALVAIVCLIILVAGGFKYFSAGGDKDATYKAKLTLTYGLGGLIIALSAWIVVSLLGQFLGVDFGTFNICITPGC